jgi:hypothetical protein
MVAVPLHMLSVCITFDHGFLKAPMLCDLWWWLVVPGVANMLRAPALRLAWQSRGCSLLTGVVCG